MCSRCGVKRKPPVVSRSLRRCCACDSPLCSLPPPRSLYSGHRVNIWNNSKQFHFTIPWQSSNVTPRRSEPLAASTCPTPPSALARESCQLPRIPRCRQGNTPPIKVYHGQRIRIPVFYPKAHFSKATLADTGMAIMMPTETDIPLITGNARAFAPGPTNSVRPPARRWSSHAMKKRRSKQIPLAG